MAERGAVIVLEEDLTCPICLAVYSKPVSLSCGHSFCKECIQGARQQQCLQGGFSCPLCSTQTDPTAELKPNIQLCSIVQKFWDAPAQEGEEESESQCEEKKESSGQQDGLIQCDFCLQKPQPAVKTCLHCEVSLCQVHLGKHSAKSLLKGHVLVEPCDERVLAERKCPQHDKLLECYCKTDSVCICILCCVSSSHKNHRIIPLEEAYSVAQSAFPKALERARRQEAALNQCIAGLLKQEEEVKTKESLKRNHLESLFKTMHQQLDNKKEKLLGTLRHYEEKQLSLIQTQIEKHKEEKNAASRDVQELEALRDQKDIPIFVKAFGDVTR
ncbi:E3 ubiquitin-protein ligase TRIM47-like isoform 2-T2 [Porphyrio hochstetteri]